MITKEKKLAPWMKSLFEDISEIKVEFNPFEFSSFEIHAQSEAFDPEAAEMNRENFIRQVEEVNLNEEEIS